MDARSLDAFKSLSRKIEDLRITIDSKYPPPAQPVQFPTHLREAFENRFRVSPGPHSPVDVDSVRSRHEETDDLVHKNGTMN